MKLTTEKINFKKLITIAGAALCATSLAFATDNSVANADTVDNAKYTVQSGDTLWTIAQRYQVDLDQLEALNNKDANHTLIMPGEVLTLPTHSNDNNSQTANTVPTTAESNQASQAQTVQAPVQQTGQSNQTQSTNVAPAVKQPVAQVAPTSSNSNSAKEWIAQRESGGSYSARNGQYVGRYQLSSAYLNGDYSPANQERAANKYVSQRYGSWANAKSFWQSHGWY